MSEQRLFHATNLDLPHLSHALTDWYRAQRFEVQMWEAPGGGAVIQARQEEAWRSVLGMSTALNILLRPQQDGNLVVEIGAGKWADKAAAAGVGVFILWPMLITAGFGAWQQSKLPQRTFEFIQNFIATGGSVSADMAMIQASQLDQARRVFGSMSAMGTSPGMAPNMHQTAPVMQQQQQQFPPVTAVASASNGAPEEGTVGTAETVPARFCIECGTKLPPTARFCPGCGAKAVA